MHCCNGISKLISLEFCISSSPAGATILAVQCLPLILPSVQGLFIPGGGGLLPGGGSQGPGSGQAGGFSFGACPDLDTVRFFRPEFVRSQRGSFIYDVHKVHKVHSIACPLDKKISLIPLDPLSVDIMCECYLIKPELNHRISHRKQREYKNQLSCSPNMAVLGSAREAGVRDRVRGSRAGSASGPARTSTLSGSSGQNS